MERRREDWAARKAGRLLARSLVRARFALRMATREGASWGAIALELDAVLETWPQYADTLAGTITNSDDWHEIVQSVEALERIHQPAKYGGDRAIDQETAKFLSGIAEQVWAAAFTASLIGVVGVRRRPIRRQLLRLKRWRGFDEAEEARKLSDYAYALDEDSPPERAGSGPQAT